MIITILAWVPVVIVLGIILWILCWYIPGRDCFTIKEKIEARTYATLTLVFIGWLIWGLTYLVVIKKNEITKPTQVERFGE